MPAEALAEQPRGETAPRAPALSPALQRLEQRLGESRRALAANPADSRHAVAFAVRVQTAMQTGAFRDDPAEQERLVREAAGYLEAAAQRQTDDRPTLLALLGELWLTHGALPEAKEALEASLAAKANLMALTTLLPMLGRHQQYEDVQRHCRDARPSLSADDERYALLVLCAEQGGATEDEALAWASADEREWLRSQRALRQPHEKAP